MIHVNFLLFYDYSLTSDFENFLSNAHTRDKYLCYVLFKSFH